MACTRFHLRIRGNIVIGILALAALVLQGRAVCAQQASLSGFPIEAVSGTAVMPPGPLPFGPPVSNLSTGGVLPEPASPCSASICP